MSTVKFIRITQQNGRHQPLTPAAQRFWQGIGGLVGTILRPETPLTFTEIGTAYADYTAEDPDIAPFPFVDVPLIAWALLRLVELDLAAIVIEPPHQAVFTGETAVPPTPLTTYQTPTAPLTSPPNWN